MKSFVGLIVAIGVAAGVAYCTGRQDGRATVQTDTERAIDSALAVRAAVIETITVAAPAVRAAAAESERLARVVTIAGPSELRVQLTPAAPAILVPVHAAVVARIRADSVTIARQAAQLRNYERLAREDSVVIRAQDLRIAELERGRRCGPKCGATIALLTVVAAAAAVQYSDELLDVIIPGQQARPIMLITLRGR